MQGQIFFVALCLFVGSIEGQILGSDIQQQCQNSPLQPVNLMVDLPALPAGPLDTLKSLATAAQAQVLPILQNLFPNLNLKQFWIENRISVKNVPCALATTLANNPLLTLLTPLGINIRLEQVSSLNSTGSVQILPNAVLSGVQWGIQKINANGMWGTCCGAGIRVANIDSGVMGNHSALAGNYVNDGYGWLDGITNSSVGGPTDVNGHGTHTMGTICGGNGIGVAPCAKWMACRACDTNGSCSEAAVLTCGQFFQCPYETVTNTSDCSKRPKIINNSWGSMGSKTTYNVMNANWVKAGIIPVYAIGNDGDSCGTTGSPGNQPNTIGVASTRSNDSLSTFSSRWGSTLVSGTPIKPDIAAPGENITSAYFSGVNDYAIMSGTSMASPHVAGAAALLLCKNSTLTFNQIVAALKSSSYQPKVDVTEYCGSNIPFFKVDPQYPNGGYGMGRIDALAASKKL